MTDAYAQAQASQRLAADPARSVFVTANAGSGKTKVLIDRIARLLLAGGRPEAFLCTTYTKAAAAEMQRRLFERLGGWCVLADAPLAAELSALTGASGPPPAEDLARARALFARALETPGGLKIQTIHAFAERLIGRFPLEAGVAPGFDILDDAAAAEVRAAAREHILTGGADPALRAAHDRFAARLPEGGFEGLLATLIAREGQAWAEGLPLDQALDRAAARHGRPGAPEAVAAALLAATPWADYPRCAAALDGGNDTETKLAQELRTAAREQTLDALTAPFLTKEGAPRARPRWPGARLRKTQMALTALLEAEQDRIVAGLERLRAAERAADAAAALRLAAALGGAYAQAKTARGALDFEDLIVRARALLSRADAAPWVLFKLDGGIDHILVDEGQDTSAGQWALIRPLQEEFFAGAGARVGRARTVFAVGDPKQSIFSFQGAAPEEFLAEAQTLSARAAAANQPFAAPDLTMSFRSSPEVLELVDAVFGADSPEAGPPGEFDRVVHTAQRAGEPGAVAWWPLAPRPERADARPWDAPLDSVRADSAPAVLAAALAKTVAGWIADGDTVWDRGVRRPMRPGDVLALVRKRGPVFHALMRAFKRAGLPVAGADRLVLREEPAVEDLLALMRFALDPADDLSLACVLKGPWVGWADDDRDLFALAHGRGQGETLWARLEASADPAHAPARALAQGLLDRRGAHPHAFLAAALEGPTCAGVSGWRAVQERLGLAARDPLEEVLTRALSLSARGAPSLSHLLAELETDAAPIKREMEEAGAAVRMMTVHGAKGLEAPVVLLPDTTSADPGDKGVGVFPQADGLIISPAPGEDDAVAAEARAAAMVRGAREQRRLLYVALTRPRDRLVVCGAALGNRSGGAAAGSWHGAVGAAMAKIGLPCETPFGLGWRLGPEPVRAPRAGAAPADREAPAWAAALAPQAPALTPLAPSRAHAHGPALSPRAGPARRRGVLIHGLLERLPALDPARRAAAGAAWLARQGVDPGAAPALLAEALAVLDDPAFAPAFGPASRGEAPIVGEIAGRPVRGVVDRLALTADTALVVDFKTDRPAPMDLAAVPVGYLVQMGVYRRVLAAALPGRTVACALVWTEAPRLLPLPEAALEAAIATALNPPHITKTPPTGR